MTNEMHKKRIRSANKKIDLAKQRLARAVRDALPIGSAVRVYFSNASVVRGKVTGHGPEWCGSTDVYIVNVLTGKRRKFYPTFHEWERLS